jgi:hypothetical protein
MNAAVPAMSPSGMDIPKTRLALEMLWGKRQKAHFFLSKVKVTFSKLRFWESHGYVKISVF